MAKRCFCFVLSYPIPSWPKAYDMLAGSLFIFEEFPKVNVPAFEVDASHVHFDFALCLAVPKVQSRT